MIAATLTKIGAKNTSYVIPEYIKKLLSKYQKANIRDIKSFWERKQELKRP